jgi:hypothetical protein
MTFWRLLALSMIGLLGATGPDRAVLAATGENPDWPCIQRLVPEIAPAVVWAGPPLDPVDGPPSPAIDRLAEELAARRVPLTEAEAQVEAFAETLAAEQKDAQLTRLFARTLAIINQDRTSIIQGIKKYARGERARAESITEKNERLSELPADRILEREALIAERDWDIRIYDDRRSALPYLCEQPVLLEQRAFALGRAIAGQLE